MTMPPTPPRVRPARVRVDQLDVSGFAATQLTVLAGLPGPVAAVARRELARRNAAPTDSTPLQAAQALLGQSMWASLPADQQDALVATAAAQQALERVTVAEAAAADARAAAATAIAAAQAAAPQVPAVQNAGDRAALALTSTDAAAANSTSHAAAAVDATAQAMTADLPAMTTDAGGA